MANEKLIYADSAKMVVEYIEQHLVASDSEFIQGYLAGTKEMANGLAKMPPVDAAPVVHGRWVNPYMNRYGHPCHCCSVCGFKASYQDKYYCPNCGAKMDGGEKNER